MAVRCKECGAFMEHKYKGHIRSFWKCPNCKREVAMDYKEYQKIRKNRKDEFI